MVSSYIPLKGACYVRLHTLAQPLCRHRSLNRMRSTKFFEEPKFGNVTKPTLRQYRYIGVDFRVCAKIHVKKMKKFSMDGNAQAEPCTRKSAWFRSATCMVGLRNLHGSARRSAWFRFRRCMNGLKNHNLRDKMSRPFDRF